MKTNFDVYSACGYWYHENEFSVRLKDGWNDQIKKDLGKNMRPTSTKQIMEWLLSEYKEPPIKLTQFEYDLLASYSSICAAFDGSSVLMEMKQRGHFKNIDLNMTLEDILNSCEVVD